MREEKVGARAQDYHIEQSLQVLLLQLTLQVKRAELRNVELKVVTEDTLEVRIDTHFFEIFDGSRLVSIHAHHGLNDHLMFFSTEPLVNIEPLLEALHERLLGHCLRLLTANAAA